MPLIPTYSYHRHHPPTATIHLQLPSPRRSHKLEQTTTLGRSFLVVAAEKKKPVEGRRRKLRGKGKEENEEEGEEEENGIERKKKRKRKEEEEREEEGESKNKIK